MTYRLYHSGAASALFGPSPLLPRHEGKAIRDAAELLDHARTVASEASAVRAQAYAEGKAEASRLVLAENGRRGCRRCSRRLSLGSLSLKSACSFAGSWAVWDRMTFR